MYNKSKRRTIYTIKLINTIWRSYSHSTLSTRKTSSRSSSNSSSSIGLTRKIRILLCSAGKVRLLFRKFRSNSSRESFKIWSIFSSHYALSIKWLKNSTITKYMDFSFKAKNRIGGTQKYSNHQMMKVLILSSKLHWCFNSTRKSLNIGKPLEILRNTQRTSTPSSRIEA